LIAHQIQPSVKGDEQRTFNVGCAISQPILDNGIAVSVADAAQQVFWIDLILLWAGLGDFRS
jgi:hypothetical protein